MQLIRRPDTLHAEHFKERKESHTAHGKAKLDEWEEIEKKKNKVSSAPCATFSFAAAVAATAAAPIIDHREPTNQPTNQPLLYNCAAHNFFSETLIFPFSYTRPRYERCAAA